MQLFNALKSLFKLIFLIKQVGVLEMDMHTIQDVLQLSYLFLIILFLY